METMLGAAELLLWGAGSATGDAQQSQHPSSLPHPTTEFHTCGTPANSSPGWRQPLKLPCMSSPKYTYIAVGEEPGKGVFSAAGGLKNLHFQTPKSRSTLLLPVLWVIWG